MKRLLASGTWIFGFAAILMGLANHSVAGWLAGSLGLDPLLAWFAAVIAIVVAPLLIVAWSLLRNEPEALGRPLWSTRLRFRPMTAGDWRASIRGLAVVALATAPIAAILVFAFGRQALHPPFLGAVPLAPERRWLLLAWVPFWLVNIMGEEILWRGIIQPRQERVYGSQASIANALGWAVFHVAFGWKMLFMLAPIFVVLPRVVQRRENTWAGVVIHGALNGPSFLAVALGIV